MKKKNKMKNQKDKNKNKTIIEYMTKYFSKALRDMTKCSLFSWDFGRCLYCQRWYLGQSKDKQEGIEG